MDPVTVCNMALLSFGQERIESIEEDDLDSVEAELCSTYYLPAVRAVLEERAWLFATDYITLANKQPTPFTAAGGCHSFVAKFLMPNTVIRPLAFDDGSGTFTIRAERNGKYIVSEDTDSLIVKCIQMIPDPNDWTPNFVFAVSYKLASVIAGPITHSAAKVKEALELYAVALKDASSLDGMAGTTNQQVKMVTDSLSNRRI